NKREYLGGETVWRKKYLYVLRPLLAMRWIEAGLGPVPIEFSKLVHATVSIPDLRSAIGELLADKKAGLELGAGPRIPPISCFIESEMSRLEKSTTSQLNASLPTEQLNELFRATLMEVWQGQTG